MRYALLQVGDITALDPSLGARPASRTVAVSWARSLAMAASQCIDDDDVVVIVLTGDVAQDGSAGRQAAGRAFIGDMAHEFERLRGSLPGIVAVPGNLDVDFEAAPLRSTLLKMSPDDLGGGDARRAIEGAFKSFYDSIENAGGVEPRGLGECTRGAAWTCTVGDVEFVCLNTALFLRPQDRPGQLRGVIPELPESSAVVRVCIMHHHHSWFDRGTAAQFRRRVGDHVSYVCIGHESLALQRQQFAEAGAGYAIQHGQRLDIASGQGSVRLLELDIAKRQQRETILRLDYDGVHAEVVVGEDDVDHWRAMPGPLNQQAGKPRPKASFLHELDELELGLTGPDGELLTLRSIFVDPVLTELDLSDNCHFTGHPVARNGVARQLATKVDSAIISGDELSGRSALARMLCFALIDAGMYPVLIDGADVSGTLPAAQRAIDRRLRECYEIPDGGHLTSISVDRRVLVVDDFNLSRRKRRKERLAELRGLGARVFLFADEIAFDIGELIEPDLGISLRRFKIEVMGHVARDQLVRRWCELQSDCEAAGEATRQINQYMARINGIIGRNFVPAFPPYILSILQSYEAARPIDMGASTHGAFYEVFIKEALQRVTDSVRFDIVSSFLGSLAHHLFQRRERFISRPEAEGVYRAFARAKDLHDRGSSDIDVLIRASILSHSVGGTVGFKYPYQYYYFLAAWLKERLQVDTEQTMAQIDELVRHLHREEHANTLLFLVHLSYNQGIVDALLEAADRQYRDFEPAQLEEDAAFLGNLDNVLSEVSTFADRDLHETRDEWLQHMDERDARPSDAPEDTSAERENEEPDILGRLSLALKTLQVLGQVVKNFPGRLDSSTKTRVIEACTRLGLRIISWFFAQVVDPRGDLAMIVQAIRTESPDWSDERVEAKALKLVSWLTVLVTDGIIFRIAQAIGSPELEIPYERIFPEGTTAYRLVQAAVHLDQIDDFPLRLIKEIDGQILGHRLAGITLRNIVRRHMLLFPLQRTQKQKICALLGMEYQGIQRLPRERALVATDSTRSLDELRPKVRLTGEEAKRPVQKGRIRRLRKPKGQAKLAGVDSVVMVEQPPAGVGSIATVEQSTVGAGAESLVDDLLKIAEAGRLVDKEKRRLLLDGIPLAHIDDHRAPHAQTVADIQFVAQSEEYVRTWLDNARRLVVCNELAMGLIEGVVARLSDQANV